MDKNFNPQQYENMCYQFWEKQGFFSCGQSLGSPYTIMLPPPNITGRLHMGHGFQQTLMDILIRYHRMKGNDVLWQPGTDHAGIAAQMIVERHLNSIGISRYDLGRKKFIDQMWKWKKSSGNKITTQMRQLGLSIDWRCERFTMDEGLSYAVKEAFVRLYEDNLIYRGERLVNWDPILLTAISDLEVIHSEEQGFLWHIYYPIINGGLIEVATTRPETILGDVAIAVHPNDKRFVNLIGKKVKVPLTNRMIPIISDEYVEPNFGTGCVKVTPAHDFNDFKIGKRHQLPLINIFTKSAKLNNSVSIKYQGLDRFDARNKIIDELTNLGLLVRKVPHVLTVPKGDRSGSILEPYLTKQWFVKTDILGKSAIEVVEKEKVKFYPIYWKNTYYAWMRNLEDWCISRQLWWGHRIPAWYDNDKNIYVARNEIEVRQKYQLNDDVILKQDSDVFDTWFSSALWPFSTLGWPKNTTKLKKYYPSNVLVTGFDIIFFWISRMIMFGLYFMKKPPFTDIYITGLVKDEKGQKMSKSKGNVLDPIDLINGICLKNLIKKRTEKLMQPDMKSLITKNTTKYFLKGIQAYGADAVRFTFMSLASTSRDICFDISRVEGYRNFANKLWNASRFVIINTIDFSSTTMKYENLLSTDKWIYHLLNETIKKVHQYISQYRFDLVSQILYNFIWHEYCDWYIEFTKIQLKLTNEKKLLQGTQCTLIIILENILKLLHPVMPFITENIFQHFKELRHDKNLSIMMTKYPKFNDKWFDINSYNEIYWLKKIITTIRTMRAEININPNIKLLIYISNTTKNDLKQIQKNAHIIYYMAKITEIKITRNPPKFSITHSVNTMSVHIPLSGLVNPKIESIRLQKKQKKLQLLITKISEKFENQKFIENAPSNIIKKEKEKLLQAKKMQSKLNVQLELFSLQCNDKSKSVYNISKN